MKTSTRKKIGCLLVLLALGALAGLALSEVQLVTVTTRPLPATGAQTRFMLAHWSLVLVCLTFVAGVGLISFPRHERAD